MGKQKQEHKRILSRSHTIPPKKGKNLQPVDELGEHKPNHTTPQQIQPSESSKTKKLQFDLEIEN